MPPSDKPSLLSAGGGIPRTPDEQEPEDEEVPTIPVETVTNERGDPVWSDTPTLADQWARHPETCQQQAIQVVLFNLEKALDLFNYNELLRDGYPAEAPRVLILQDLVYPPTEDGKVLALVRYRRLRYKKLIKPT